MSKKKVFIALVLMIVVFNFAFLLPSSYVVERAETVSTSPEDTYSYLVNLEAAKEWNPWIEQEPEAEFKIEGIPGVVGSSSEWNGKKIGAGKQTLISLEEPKYIEYKLEFSKPSKGEAKGYFKLEDSSSGTKVIWGMKSENLGPFGRVMGLFMDSMLGRDFEKGLANLKNRLEKPAPAN